MRWDYSRKVRDFLKPGVKLLDLNRQDWGGVPEESLDLIICRHIVCDLRRVYSLLKPGGFFVTEQLGAQDSGAPPGCPPDYNLENQAPIFEAAGFRIMSCDQDYRRAGIYGELMEHRFIIAAKKVKRM